MLDEDSSLKCLDCSGIFDPENSGGKVCPYCQSENVVKEY